MTIQFQLARFKHADVAQATGLSRPYVTQLLHGHRVPSISVLIRLARFLGSTDSEIGASVREWADLHESDDKTPGIHKQSSQCEAQAVVS